MFRSRAPMLSLLPLMIGPLGFQEMLVIMLLALMLFGPRKLPQIGKTLGKTIGEFRRTGNELRNTLEREVQMEEFREARADVKGFGNDLRDGIAGATQPEKSAAEAEKREPAEPEAAEAPPKRSD